MTDLSTYIIPVEESSRRFPAFSPLAGKGKAVVCWELYPAVAGIRIFIKGRDTEIDVKKRR